jgi:osmotically-inducible protein OsmY
MKRVRTIAGSLFLAALLSIGVAAETTSAGRYDASITTAATQKLAGKAQFHSVKASAQDGIITLTGTFDLYQDKLDAAKNMRKLKNAAGVRNLIQVTGTAVSDSELQAQLTRKIYYDRVGYYDNAFNYVTVAVKDGVVTLAGQTYNDVGRDAALALTQRMPGVKDVVDNIQVLPTSIFDDGLRRRAARVIYGDAALGRYSIDPARPIRIIVDNGHVTLEGQVQSTMDKQIAGMRANQLPGAFSVQNNLMVETGSKEGM